jgi:N-acetylglucosamine-6-phosphate deacetylase
VLDASGLVIEPGFVDVQVNGGFGHDLTTGPDRVWDVGAGLARHGLTAFLPTLMSPAIEEAQAADRVLAAGPPAGWSGAVPLGLHLEGPALAPERRGAHDPDRLSAPTPALVSRWLELSNLAMVTLAPELPGALVAIPRLREAGVVVSIGHSEAPGALVRAATDAGATMVTHLYNAMAPFHHRDPGVVGAVLGDDRLAVGLIADGRHVAPDALTLAWRAAGPGRILLTGDAVAGLGADGDGDVARTADGTRAGGTTPFPRVRRTFLAAIGVELDVSGATSTNACRVLGATDRGSTVPGARADLVLLDPHGEPGATVVGGRVVHDPEGRLSPV